MFWLSIIGFLVVVGHSMTYFFPSETTKFVVVERMLGNRLAGEDKANIDALALSRFVGWSNCARAIALPIIGLGLSLNIYWIFMSGMVFLLIANLAFYGWFQTFVINGWYFRKKKD